MYYFKHNKFKVPEEYKELVRDSLKGMKTQMAIHCIFRVGELVFFTKEMFETESLPSFSYTVSGFVNDESDTSVVTTAPTLSTDADNTVPGDYTIVASGAAATNYEAVYVNGNLKVKTVAKPKVTGLAVSDTSPVEGDKVTMTATATGDLLTYDWYLGADLVQSGSSNTLVVTDIGEDKAGRYTVFANTV